MTAFMNTMHNLLRGEPTPVDEEGILPGIQDMMRQMGHTGNLVHKSPRLPDVLQDLVDRGFASVESSAEPPTQIMRLSDKGKAYIARIGGAITRMKPTTITITAAIVPPKSEPDETA